MSAAAILTTSNFKKSIKVICVLLIVFGGIQLFTTQKWESNLLAIIFENWFSIESGNIEYQPLLLRDTFQPITREIRDLFFYSAYLDPRFAHSVKPLSIRIVTLAKFDFSNQYTLIYYKRFGNNLVCQINFYNNKRKRNILAVTTNATWHQYGGVGDYRYGAFDCDVTNISKRHFTFLPFKVSIGIKNKTTDIFETWLYVDTIPYPQAINFNDPNVYINISACVKGIHDFDRYNRLIEYIEAQAMWGVNHFYLYYMSASPQVDALLRYYAQHSNDTRYRKTNNGIEKYHLIVQVVPWQLPEEIRLNLGLIAYYGQQVSENDCLMRSAAAGFTHAVRTDIDDFLLPTGKHISWRDLMLFISQNRPKEKIVAFAFRSLWFDPQWYSNDTNHDNIETLTVFRHVTRSFQVADGFIKCITDLRYVVFADVHFIMESEPNTIMHLCNDTTEGVFHHYRYVDGTSNVFPKENRTLNFGFLKYNTSEYRNAIFKVKNGNWKYKSNITDTVIVSTK